MLLDYFLGGVIIIVLKELFEAPPENRAPRLDAICVQNRSQSFCQIV